MKNAIMLAAGMGERAIPLTYELPKGMLKVNGEPMIERQIIQLVEAGIKEIIIVTGYMRDKLDYLVDKYGVMLIFNPDYAIKNNLSSLYVAREYLGDSYILVSDNYLTKNIFSSESDPYSWFSCAFVENESTEWLVTKQTDEGAILEITIGGKNAYAIQGPAYFTKTFSDIFKKYLYKYNCDAACDDYYWEHILKNEITNLPTIFIKDTTGFLYEFESLEELRNYDCSYMSNTGNAVMQKIAAVFGCSEGDIYDISIEKRGMSNHSFCFRLMDNAYICRVPCVEMNELVDRHLEGEIFDELSAFDISDEVLYFNKKTGFKIAKFYASLRTINPYDDDDLKMSMNALKSFHHLNLQIPEAKEFSDVFEKYVDIVQECDSGYLRRHEATYLNMKKLLLLRKTMNVPEQLCHGDYQPENMLLLSNKKIRIIDWEYACKSDPIMDVALYAIFAQFDKQRSDFALTMYLEDKPQCNECIRLYLYMALCGFMWALWTAYKRKWGKEFGNYENTQLAYAKDFYTILAEEFNAL